MASLLVKKKVEEAAAAKANAPTPEEIAKMNPMKDLVPESSQQEAEGIVSRVTDYISRTLPQPKTTVTPEEQASRAAQMAQNTMVSSGTNAALRQPALPGGTVTRQSIMPNAAVYTTARKQPVQPQPMQQVSMPYVEEGWSNQQKYEAAQKAYDDYVNTDAYKNYSMQQMVNDAYGALRNSGVSTAPIANVQNPVPKEDTGEKQLRLVRDYYKQQYDAEEDQKITDANLAEFETWSPEDKVAMGTYIENRPEGFGGMILNIAAGMSGSGADARAAGKRNTDATLAYQTLVEKYGEETVKKIAETLDRQKNEETTQQMTQAAQEAVAGKPGAAFFGSVATVPMKLGNSITGPLGIASNFATKTGQYSTLDPNNLGNLLGTSAGAARGQVAEDIAGNEYDEQGNKVKDGGVVRQGASLAYQGVMSLADSLARSLTLGPAGGAALAATDSFSQAVSEASAQGATPGQAVAIGVTTAGIEYLTEKIPMDEVFRVAKSGDTKVLAQMFKQAGIEITTEELSLFGTIVAEAEILREKSSYNQQIGEAMANGATYEEAKAAADNAVLNEALTTAAVSGFAGMASGGGSAAVGNVFGSGTQTQNQTDQRPVAAPETAQATTETKPVTVEQAAAEDVAQQIAQRNEAQRSEPAQEAQIAEDVAQQILEKQGAEAGKGIDTANEQIYNNTNNTTGGIVDDGSERRLYEASGTGLSGGNERGRTAGGYSGTVQVLRSTSGGVEPGSQLVSGNVQTESAAGGSEVYLGASGEFRVSEGLRAAQQARGTPVFAVKETTAESQNYEAALNAARAADTRNGWCVTPKSADEMQSGNVRTFMNGNGTAGVGVAPDGDIVAVFKNPNGGPRKAMDTLIPIAIEQGGTKLDCYGEGLVKVYSQYGFIPVARVEFNPEYANDGWTPDKGQPYIYMMMHNGDSAETVAANIGKYSGMSQEQLDALPTFGKDGYDEAMNLRDEMLAERKTGAGIKGTGAAEANFSGKAQYQDLLYEGNVQPDREGDARPMEVPKTDSAGNAVSEVAANVYGSQYTSDDLASEMETAIEKGDLGYVEISNDKAAEQATANIEKAGGWDEAYMQWHDRVRDGAAGAEMAARGAMILNHYAEAYEQAKATGDVEATKAAKQKWISTLLDVRELGTNTAQGLQAMRLIRELSPPDKLDFAVASVRRMVAAMKLQNDVKIDENLLNEYRMAETDEQRNEIMGRIQQNVADQIPSTFLDKWNALRYMNMLGNLKTNVRNVAGNIGSAVAYRMKDQVAATMEDVISVVNKDYQRTKAHTVSRPLLNFAKQDFNNVRGTVSGGGKYNDRMTAAGEFEQGVMDKRRIYKNPLLEGYRKGTNWMMNNKYFGDEAFGRAAYARALAGYLKSNGVKDSDLGNVDPALLDKARAYAVQQAQEAVFHDNTALANVVSKVQKSTGVVGQAIMPFTKTPANVLVRAEEFSPLGIVNTAIKTAQYSAGKTAATEKTGKLGDFARAGADITGADIADSLAKTITGSALFALGAALFDQGWLSGGPDDDEKEAAFDDLTGKQPYALTLPNGQSYTMDWLTPVAMPMFMGAEFWKVLQEADGEITFADMEQVFTSIADPMVQMSMLQGLNDTLDGIKWADSNLGQFFINAAISYLTQGLTNTLVGQLEKSTEENRMTTYVDKDSNLPPWLQRTLGKASQKVPSWDFQQMEYRNAWGETEKNEGGLVYNLLSPGYLSQEQTGKVNDELRRVYDSTGENVFPQTASKAVTYTDNNGVTHTDYNLSQTEYDTMQRVQGQTYADMLDRMVNHREYEKLTDEQKAYAINAVYQYSQEQGKKAALPDYYSKAAGWIQSADGRNISDFIVRGTVGPLESAIDKAVADLGNGWTVTAATKKNIEETYASYRKLGDDAKQKVLETVAGNVAKYLEVRGKGVSTQSYLDAVDNVQELGKNPKAADKYDAIVSTPNASDSTIDALMKAYMTDYDPNDTSPDKTELKYEYARRQLEMSPKEYVDVYRIYTEGGKKAEMMGKWKGQGYTDAECTVLWNLFKASGDDKIDVISWYENQ